VIAQSDIVRMFREEWPAAECDPRQAAGDRIVSALSSLWLPRSMIAPAPSSDPDGCRNNLVRFTRQGSTKMTKTSTAVAGIDTAKDKLDIAIHGQASHWQVENTLRGVCARI